MLGRFVVVGLVILITETVDVVVGVFIEMVEDLADVVRPFVGVFVRMVYVGFVEDPEDVNKTGNVDIVSKNEQATLNINSDNCKQMQTNSLRIIPL